MPVTAKLSRKFYEVFGDDIANELVNWFNAVDATYRTDLRELNEINFARFDAKVEQRFAQHEAGSERRFARLEAAVDRRFAETDASWEQRFTQLEAAVDRRFAETDAKWQQRFAQLEATVDRRFAETDAKLERRFAEQRADLLRWMFVYWGGSVVTTVGLVLLVLKTVT